MSEASVNKAVDVLIPQHDRASASVALSPLDSTHLSLSFSLARARDEARSAAGFALGGEGRGGTVIIKSCNQLANLSSSVLIKPGPHRAFCFSFSLFRLSLLLVSLYLPHYSFFFPSRARSSFFSFSFRGSLFILYTRTSAYARETILTVSHFASPCGGADFSRPIPSFRFVRGYF